MKKILFAVLPLASILLASCGGKDSADNNIHGEVKGKITVLTNRTDIVDTKLAEYKKAFEEKYPGTTVEFEAITDYEGTVRTRMSTQEYGDVLCRPDIQSVDYPNFFEPLGTTEEFSEIMSDFAQKGTNPISYDGTVYVYPLVAVVPTGLVCNKKVFESAGAEIPRSTKDFYAALGLIKKNTKAIPIYMNYPAGWTLNQWEGGLLSECGDIEYQNKVIHNPTPFYPKDGHYELYKVMYDVVKMGFCERDLIASDWERSKQMLADGGIGCMVLGSWAIAQVRALSKNPDEIGYIPFPAEVDGKKYAEVNLDMPLCINKYSKNKATAYAWVRFIADETDWVEYTQSIPVKKGEKMPSVLDDFEKMGVEYLSFAAARPGEEGIYNTLDKDSEIGFLSDPEKKRIIDAAVGTRSETFEDIMADWNNRWAKANAVN